MSVLCDLKSLKWLLKATHDSTHRHFSFFIFFVNFFFFFTVDIQFIFTTKNIQNTIFNKKKNFN